VIVPDASAIILLFADASKDARVFEAAEIIGADVHWVVPEHWRIEVLSALRGLSRAELLSESKATEAVAWVTSATVAILPTPTITERVWGLRHNLTAYDAAYVATAEHFGATLVTADARIERAGVVKCPIRVIR
jgi:predicted nucleic acid-binding protein